MFKKRFKVSNSHAVSNKDRKNLRQEMLKQGYDEQLITHFLNDKNYGGSSRDGGCEDNSLTMDKLAGSRCVIYNRGNTPYFFCLEPKQ